MMDGWYVKKLILDRDNIRSNVYSKLDEISPDYYSGITIESTLDDDTYLDLLDVESRINELIKKGLLDKKEISVLKSIFDGKSYSDISREQNSARSTVTSIFNRTCTKISFYLGGHFTNDGFIEYLAEKYKLTDIEIEKLRRYINNG